MGSQSLALISEKRRVAIMVELHRTIHEEATAAARLIAKAEPTKRPFYPPEAELNAEERIALDALPKSDAFESAVRKLVADAIGSAFFHHFNIIDGTGNPLDWTDDEWMPMQFGESEEDADGMLHDLFYESYWEWFAVSSESNGETP